MKISKIPLLLLKNSTHFQLHTEFKDLIEKQSAEALKITAQFNAYLPLYNTVDSGLKKITKSALTAQIEEADKARDEIWSGLVEMNKAATKHFDPNIAQAAERLKIVFDTYGNLANLPINDQTSLTNNIFQELKDKHGADVRAVGIDKWLAELNARNTALDNLMKERFDESASKTDIILKEARAELDKSYTTITERLNAFAVVAEDVSVFEAFIKTWNVIVEKYKNALKRNRQNPDSQDNRPADVQSLRLVSKD